MAAVAALALAGPAHADNPSAPSPHATLQQQAECKAVAEKYASSWWDDSGKDYYGHPYGEGEHDGYYLVSHMNAKLGVCFALIHIVGGYYDKKDKRDHHSFHSRYMLRDAVADRVYADYDWTNDQDKKYWEVKPTTCWAGAGDGSQNYCQSEDEFFKAINSYTTD